MGFIQDMAKSMAQMEGWSKTSVSWKNNNPGNLIYGKTMVGKDSRGFAIFSTLRDGWGELEDLIERVIKEHPGLTFQTFFAGQRDAAGQVIPNGYPGYAPAQDQRGPNSPNVYATFVASNLQCSITDQLAGKLSST